VPTTTPAARPITTKPNHPRHKTTAIIVPDPTRGHGWVRNLHE